MNPEIDGLEARLRSAPHLDDGGFTDRVLAALPPRRTGARGPVLVVSAVAAGMVGALALAGPLADASRAIASASPVVVLLAGAGTVLAAAFLARLGGEA